MKRTSFSGFILRIFLGLLFHTPAWAGIDPPVLKVLDGNLQQIKKDSFSIVEDSKFFDASYNAALIKPYKVQNKISLRINEASTYFFQTPFSASVQVRIYFTKANLDLDSIDKTLSITYDSTATYLGNANYVFTNGYRVKVKVLSTTATVSWDVWKGIVLANELQSFPVFTFSCTGDAVQSVGTQGLPANTNSDELPVSWQNKIAADEYDLEWAYVDSSALINNVYGPPSNPDPNLIFLNNASRVTLSATAYTIPLFYDGGGALFFRVRSAQHKEGIGRIEANWSSDYAGGLGRFDYYGHSRNLNWQAKTSFAEDGKRKTVVHYYDGNLYNRQTVTKDNSTNTTIVAESIYDFQGRPVIQVLPSPTLSSIIQYTKDFNRGLNGSAYDKDQFDVLVNPAAYCNQITASMDTTSGAAQYYSPNNPLKNTSFHSFIPDAKGYPFTQTEFTPDNTGRISSQSGVGPSYKLGSGHETKYYYGTPDQRELDALFGTEAGHYSHYFKTMVRDANGQFSVNYTNMFGKTVATALAGTPPDSIGLDALPSNSIRTITENIVDPQATVLKDLVMENKKGLLVSKPGLYQFSYQLSAQSLKLANCAGGNICYDCLYDLQITITDDCNNQKLGGQAFDTIIRNFSLSAIDTSCGNPPEGFSFNFSKFLDEGSYEVTKKLSVNRSAIDYYRDSIFAKAAICKSLQDFIKEQRDLLVLNEECKPACQSCTDSLGTWEQFHVRFLQRAGVVEDTASYRGVATEAYEKAKAACNDLCGKTSELDDIRTAMLLDLTAPSGQYANLDSTADVFSIFHVNYDAQDNPTSTAKYRTPTNYSDADGNPDLVYDASIGASVPPQQLSSQSFVQNFKLSWAKALLPFHPEFCKLTQYEALELSHQWDRRFGAVETFQEALHKGFLNPTNNNSFPFNRYNSPLGTPDSDPLSSIYSNSNNQFKTKLETQLKEYRDNNFNGSTGMSMWGLATVTAVCGNDASLTCFTTHGADNNAFDTLSICTGDLDMAWRSFRQMYLDIKREIVHAQIKAYCSSQQGSVTTASLINAHHQAHFSDAPELLPLYGANLPTTQSGANTVQQQAQADVISYYSTNCQAYVSQWWQQMKPCNFTSTDSAIVIPRLLQVCVEGSDMSHPLGASSVKPSSMYRFKSFRDVLQQYSDSIGKPFNNITCNPYLLTNPLPYERTTIYSDLPVWTKPDSCLCANFSTAYTQYQANSGGFMSFSSFVNSKYQVTMTEADLQSILALCNTTIANCTYLSQPILVPPTLQCNGPSACISCEQAAKVYSQFLEDYVGAHRLTTMDSTSLQQYYSLVSNYLNAKLGFKKTYQEYALFFQQCNVPFYPPSNTAPILGGILLNSPTHTSGSTTNVSCSTLQSISSQFTSTYPGFSQWNKVTIKRMRSYNPTVEYRQSGLGILTYTLPERTITPPKWVGSGQRDSGYAARWYRDTLTFVKFDFSSFPSRATIDSINLKLSPDFGAPFDPNIWWCNMLTAWDTTGVPLSTSYNGFRITAYTPMYQYQTPLNHKIYTYDCKTQMTNLVKLPTTNKGHVLTSFLDPAVAAHNSESFISSFHPLVQQDRETRPHVEIWYRFDTLYSCKDLIAGFFNSKLNTALSYDSIVSLYQQKCGTTFPLSCSPNNTTALLCGSTGPIFPTVDIEDITNCSDTAFFALSKGTELYAEYKDSLNRLFDSSYRAKCMEAYKMESFTVTHDVSEYHYTLYYYDQSGNLVKTIPPEGIAPNFNTLWLDSVKTAREAGSVKVPDHALPTQYRYNTLNQVIAQQSPDGGIAHFWYDRLGRLALSQNAKQKAVNTTEADRQYSYTLYDELGRITEVGQIANATTTAMTDSISRKITLLASWLSNSASRKEQVTQTVYDVAYAGFAGLANAPLFQRNLRNRVAFTSFAFGGNPAQYNSATFYTYDVHGNVDTLVQDYGSSSFAAVANVMNANNNRFKKLVYRYDLISGKVNHIAYQPNGADQFYHRYTYDADNKLTLAETSLDSVVWEKDVRYQYYKHGPLARTVLGDQQVQGLDYAYNLQGWLKGVNSTSLNADLDMGTDGKVGAQNQFVSRDAYSFSLNYFTGDYTAISNASTFPGTSAYLGSSYKPLYNGNISSMAVNIGKFSNPMLYNYTYDQLNRLKAMDAFNGLNQATNSWSGLTLLPDYRERISYDANGNILTYLRNGFGEANALPMDGLTYNYNRNAAGKLINNQLNYVADAVDAGKYTVDIDNQSANNYVYDAIGNLITDSAENITNITWSVYGKIQEIQRTATSANPVTNIQYTYDATGNRISKRVAKNGTSTIDFTWYVRDAQGNVLTTYNSSGTGSTLTGYSLTAREQYLYGSNRIGIANRSVNMKSVYQMPDTVNYYRGLKSYELTNHLGNVLVTISDKKVPHNAGNDSIDYFMADVQNATDYYPFGMMMPGRNFSAGTSYRHGFNGKENDNDVKGEGNQQDYGMRIYDPRLGRFLSVDPLMKDYPSVSPYPFAMNRPIDGVDLDGKEWTESTTITTDPNGILIKQTQITIKLRVVNQSRTITGEAEVRAISNNIAKGIENDFSASKVDFEDNNEITQLKTTVILDYTPLSAGETPTKENGFWLVLNDQTTQTRTNSAGDEEEFRIGGHTTVGETQKNVLNVTVAADGVALAPEKYTRSGSHEIGHSGGLYHPWHYHQNRSNGTGDVQTYKIVEDRRGRASFSVDREKRKFAKDNLMNSDDNPELPERNSTSRKLQDSQLSTIQRKVEAQQPKSKE